MALLTLRGAQVRLATLDESHLTATASIPEAKLNIDWASHDEMLQVKKVLDWVQVQDLVADDTSSIDLTSIIGVEAARATTAGETEGVIVEGDLNKVIIRNAVTGNPVLDGSNREVYGRLTFDESESEFTVAFYVDIDGTETTHAMPAGQDNIDLQYMQRFNLSTVSELFAANEKWCDGLADVSTKLNLIQVARDLYGADFSLNQDGDAVRDMSVADELDDARGDFDNLLQRLDAESGGTESDIKARAKELHSSGVASGLEVTADSGMDLDVSAGVAYNSEGERFVFADPALATIGTADATDPRIDLVIVDSDGDLVVVPGTAAAEPSAPATPSGAVLLATVEVAAEATEIVTGDITDSRLMVATGSEVQTARGSEDTLGDRLDAALRADGHLNDDEKLHVHKKEVFTATQDQTEILLSEGAFENGENTLDVYVNGALQAEGALNAYTEQVDGTGIDFNAGLDADDVVILCWIESNNN